MKLDNLVGRRFGLLSVLSKKSKVGTPAKWLCRCDCGKTAVVAAHHLKDGTTSSCGCKRWRKALQLTGRQFGLLTVMSRAPNAGAGTSSKARWHCRCKCGNRSLVHGSALTTGNTQSCGCLKLEAARKNGYLLNVSHGMTGSKIHFTWLSMLQRCNYHKHKSYPAYGGRGITVCERWNSFEQFYADVGEPPPRKTLDRIDNNKGYSPENCRWASNHEQANNKRNNFKVAAFGRNLTIIDWSRETGLSKATITYRLAKGMTPEELLSTPPAKGKNLIRFRKPIAA